MVFPLENGRPDVGSLLQFSKNKGLGTRLQWRIQGRGPPPTPPPIFLDQNEARRAEKCFCEDATPPLCQGLDGRPPHTPSSEGLDPPLGCFCEDAPPSMPGPGWSPPPGPHSLIWRSGSTTGLFLWGRPPLYARAGMVPPPRPPLPHLKVWIHHWVVTIPCLWFKVI